MNVRPFLPSPGHHCDTCDRKLEDRALVWIGDDGWVFCSMVCAEREAVVRKSQASCDLFARALPRLASQDLRTA